jgi:hypothetical protein
MPTIAAPVTEKIEPCDILCPACGQKHTVVHADWFNERGRKVSEREAVLVRHHIEDYNTKARTTPFQLFRTPAAQPAPKRAAVEADVKHEPTPGYFLPDWDAFKKSKKSSKKAAR